MTLVEFYGHLAKLCGLALHLVGTLLQEWHGTPGMFPQGFLTRPRLGEEPLIKRFGQVFLYLRIHFWEVLGEVFERKALEPRFGSPKAAEADTAASKGLVLDADGFFFVHVGRNGVFIDHCTEEMGRVFLNLLDNAFAATRLRAATADSEYEPVVRVQTRPTNDGGAVIRVIDNCVQPFGVQPRGHASPLE